LFEVPLNDFRAGKERPVQEALIERRAEIQKQLQRMDRLIAELAAVIGAGQAY